MSESRRHSPFGVRQQQRHKRLHLNWAEAEADIHRGQGVEKATFPGDHFDGGLRRPSEHAYVIRWFKTGTGQCQNGNTTRLFRITGAKLQQEEKVSRYFRVLRWI